MLDADLRRFAPSVAVAAGSVDRLADTLGSSDAMAVVEAGSVLRWSLGGGSTRVVKIGPAFAAALASFAERLANQGGKAVRKNSASKALELGAGALSAAAYFLEDVPEASVAEHPGLALLRDRVFEAAGANAGRRVQRPYQVRFLKPASLKNQKLLLPPRGRGPTQCPQNCPKLSRV